MSTTLHMTSAETKYKLPMSMRLQALVQFRVGFHAWPIEQGSFVWSKQKTGRLDVVVACLGDQTREREREREAGRQAG